MFIKEYTKIYKSLLKKNKGYEFLFFSFILFFSFLFFFYVKQIITIVYNSY